MLATNYSTLRENLRSYCDKVIDNEEILIITRKKNRNVVMMSLEQYNNLMENLLVLGNKKNYDRLMESLEQLKNGQAGFRELIAEDGHHYE